MIALRPYMFSGGQDPNSQDLRPPRPALNAESTMPDDSDVQCAAIVLCAQKCASVIFQ